MYTRCLNKNCPDQCQFFSPSDPPLSLSVSSTIGDAGTFNYRKKCRNCGCYEHQHHVQGFMIGSSFVPVSEPPPPLPEQTPPRPAIRYFPTESSLASSSPPFSSSSSDSNTTTSSNRKLTVNEASSNNYANMEQQRSKKESAIRADMASVYNNNAAAAPQRFRGTGRSVQNRLNNKRAFEHHRMSPPPHPSVKPNPPLDLYLLRISERAPTVQDGVLRDDLKLKGQYLENFEFCRDGGLISEAFFYQTYALQCRIAPLFHAAQGNYDFYLQVGRRQLNKLRFSNENFPDSEGAWNMMAGNCANNSSSNSSEHRWIVVAPRSNNTHHQQRRVSTSASSSASSHFTAEEEDDLLDDNDDFDVHCSSSRVEEERGSIPSSEHYIIQVFYNINNQ